MTPEKLSGYVHIDQSTGKAYVCVGEDSLDVAELLELRNQMLVEQQSAIKATMHVLRMQLFQLEKQLAETEKQIKESDDE